MNTTSGESEEPPGDRPDATAPPPRPVDRALWAFLAVVLCLVVGAGLSRLVLRDGEPPLTIEGDVPAFALVERSGRPVTSGDLRGQVWVANFIFTRCSGMCPILSTGLARLQGQAPRDVRLVSFSVDPLHDTPEVLRDYARGYGADPERWWFLTGEREALYRLVRDGFRLSVAERAPGDVADPGEIITHSDRIVLVDRGLRIRGYYHGMDHAEVERLLRDIERLRAERPS